MAFWFLLLLWAATFVVSQAIAAATTKVPKGKPPSGLGDFTFPTAQEDRPIPVVTGTVKQAGPNVIWYGNLRAYAKQEKVSTSMFTSKKVTTGYKYYLGIQFALCKGPAILKRIWIGERQLWSGSQSVEGNIIQTSTATVKFYPGNSTQTADAYLSGFQSPCPAYRDLCYVVFNGFLGMSTQIEPWSFEIQRIPNGLALVDPTVNTFDANPMNKLYEILTDTYGYADEDIDIAGTFTTAAITLKTEGNGFSLLEDAKHQTAQIIQEIEKQINGHIYLDPITGKWKIELVRGGYDIGGLDVLDSSNILEVMAFDRGTWTGTTNVVRLGFNNRTNSYTDSTSIAQDMANAQIQGQRIPTSMDMPGVRNPTLAGNLAWRELRSLSYPLASTRIRVNRSMWNIHVGKPMLFDYDEFYATAIPMRITKISMGGPGCEGIELDLIQDVFAEGIGTFTAIGSGWTPPSMDLEEFTNLSVEEAPDALIRRDVNTDEPRLLVMAQETGKGEIGYKIKVDTGGGYYDAGTIYGMAVKVTLETGVSATDTTIDLVTDEDASNFAATMAEDVGQFLTNLILLDGELIAPLTVVDTATGIRLTNCYRGLCDTAQAPHDAAVVAWLVCLGSGLNTLALTPGATLDVKLAPISSDEEVAIGDVTPIPITLSYRAVRPYPPTLLELNGSTFPVSTSIDVGATLATKGITVEYNRRDWRIFDEVSQLTVDANTLDPTFPADESTQYRLRIYDDADNLLMTVDWNADGAASIFASRTKIVRACDGVITPLRFSVSTRHTHDTVVREAIQDLSHETAITSELTGDTYLGILDTYQTSAQYTAPVTGDYVFTISAAMDADVQAKVNGGALATVIAAGNTSGTLTGVITSDVIEVRHLDNTSSDEVFLYIDAPGSDVDAYGILIFENLYGSIGGFGMGGFGLGPFGR